MAGLNPAMVKKGKLPHFGSANTTRLSPPDSQIVMAHFMWAIQLPSRPTNHCHVTWVAREFILRLREAQFGGRP
jgi:hypothetical protein